MKKLRASDWLKRSPIFFFFLCKPEQRCKTCANYKQSAHYPNFVCLIFLNAFLKWIIKEIKSAPSAFLSYISRREFLTTREKCGGARAEGESLSHFSSAYITQQCLRSFFLFLLKECLVNCARSYWWRRLRAY